jgi:hypothetical protein
MLNALANHGYLPRDGRSIRLKELKAVLTEVASLSGPLAAAFADGVFIERHIGSNAGPGFFSLLWDFVRSPFTGFGILALRNPGQVDSEGIPVVDLQQLSVRGVIEHDISLTRNDEAEGDNTSPQPVLIDALLASSSDGGETVTLDDLLKFRRQRIETQKKNNASLKYGTLEHIFGCTEIVNIMNFVGDGEKVPVRWLDPFLREERLPVKEGWKKREKPYGVLSLLWEVMRVKRLLGVKV